jgi:hypothetical protein
MIRFHIGDFNQVYEPTTLIVMVWGFTILGIDITLKPFEIAFCVCECWVSLDADWAWKGAKE